ncbi:RNA polymerase sigma factor [Bizionia gelidisalsuginis]|uniref:RNA polymerase sigma factor n=2 Tax=Bizionia TaxID=283785 RepID=A0A8H2QML7_9FLAO|nr:MULTISPECIES: RNA polymerase sigma factor [Bizionia]TYB77988.1 RNA polymerase sigma factor [Bizionia saleffrena]TYC12709.1 RNA polymerase sigma factor [Bizionia gelidisalsuginis]
MKVIQLYKNENKLIRHAIKNNREAQNALYAQHAPKMLSLCRYYIKDRHYAEDVMLNGFFKVFTHLKSFKNEGSFEGWIRRIIVRECISYLRQKKKIVFLVDDIAGAYDSEYTYSTDLDVEHIQELIDGLPQGYKMVFGLYAIEGFKHYEIAQLLNITEGTSKSQLFKARKLLQSQIKALNITSYGTT